MNSMSELLWSVRLGCCHFSFSLLAFRPLFTLSLTSHVHMLMRQFHKDLVEVFLKVMAMDASVLKKDVTVF